jgi:hypothetical protein
MSCVLTIYVTETVTNSFLKIKHFFFQFYGKLTACFIAISAFLIWYFT